jgi:hypothetical protein
VIADEHGPAHIEAVAHVVNAQRGNAGSHLAARKRCPRGHPYDEANTYINAAGWRFCRTCNRERSRAIKEPV